MDTITYKTQSLIREIRRSKDYITYQRLQKKIEENTELFQRLNEYRRRSFLLHNSPDVGNVMQEVRALREEYKTELSLPEVTEYLIVEQKVCKMIRSVSEAIADGIKVDYRFLEEE